MLYQSASKPLAFAAAFALAMSSTAFAQTTVGGQEIGEDDMPRVEQHCASLAAVDGAGTMDGDGPATDDIDADDFAADVDTPAMDEDAASENGMATTDGAADTATDDGATVDLAAITAADCEAAGIATQ